MHTSDVAVARPMAASSPSITTGAAAASPALVWLFGTALFLSAFLLFLVQPMVAKMVLPILGGAPMVWNACVVFFQIAVLAGYGYAHAMSRRAGGPRQVAAHLMVLAAPLALLPFAIDRSIAPPQGNPAAFVLIVLAGTIGLPFFALSTTASVLQHWFSRTEHPRAADPYFLYVSSNLGSLLALAAYPVLVEPWLSLGQQSRWWSIGYAAFVAAAAACGAAAWRAARPEPANGKARGDHVLPAEPISGARRARWTLFAFVPSSLMLAVTSYVSTDIAAIPLFWIVPLALYLVTFIVAFSGRSASASALAVRLMPLALVPLVMFMGTSMQAPPLVLFSLHLLAFACIALVCHGRLAQDRPGAASLTEFYFWLSFGGMLGGMFNALVAPALFNGIVEYPLVLILACLCLPASSAEVTGRPVTLDFVVSAAIGLLAGGLLALGAAVGNAPLLLGLFAIPAVAAFAQRRQPVRFALSLGALLVAGAVALEPPRILHKERTFFGVYRVTVDPPGRYHALVHGTTLHGIQALEPAAAAEPRSYFHRGGPVGDLFTQVPHAASARRVGVIGLGVGSMAAYARDGQEWTFYEIDEAVERIARTPSLFTYLEACAERCRVVLGDARLSLAAASSGAYDVFVLDAFSSDAIPVHLLTREALALYLSRLAPGGVLALHISNVHLSLSPVVAALAASHGLVALERHDTAQDLDARKNASRWVVAARTASDLGGLTRDARWKPLATPPGQAVWTDDFSNILSVLYR